jgi:hypothetical protein
MRQAKMRQALNRPARRPASVVAGEGAMLERLFELEARVGPPQSLGPTAMGERRADAVRLAVQAVR